MNEPTITITGNLTADPELRYTPTGQAVAVLRIASTPRRRDNNGQWTDGNTTFLDPRPGAPPPRTPPSPSPKATESWSPAGSAPTSTPLTPAPTPATKSAACGSSPTRSPSRCATPPPDRHVRSAAVRSSPPRRPDPTIRGIGSVGHIAPVRCPSQCRTQTASVSNGWSRQRCLSRYPTHHTRRSNALRARFSNALIAGCRFLAGGVEAALGPHLGMTDGYGVSAVWQKDWRWSGRSLA
jgi:hypothetical protein